MCQRPISRRVPDRSPRACFEDPRFLRSQLPPGECTETVSDRALAIITAMEVDQRPGGWSGLGSERGLRANSPLGRGGCSRLSRGQP